MKNELVEMLPEKTPVGLVLNHVAFFKDGPKEDKKTCVVAMTNGVVMHINISAAKLKGWLDRA